MKSSRLFLILLGTWSVNAGSLRILNGRDDIDEEYPFVVSLQIKARGIYMRSCSGSLIDANWVLTAAHCIIENPVVIRFGDMTLPHNKTNCYRKIVKAFSHPMYIERVGGHLPTVRNDIALVLIEKLENIPLAKIASMDYKTLSGLPVSYAGFGLISDDRKDKEYMTKPLQIGEGIITDCNPVDKTMCKPAICVAPKCSNNRGSTKTGDSGGPVMFEHKIIAVCHGGIFKPLTMFTPVSPYLDWIKAVLTNKHHKNNYMT